MLHGFSELDSTPLYPSYLRFRHRVFCRLPGYGDPEGPVSTFGPFPSAAEGSPWARGIEFDGCDVPTAIHLAHVSPAADGGIITGCIRMLPTTGHYMIRDAIDHGIWKDVRLLENLPRGRSVYEASRIAVAPELELGSPARTRVIDSLVYGHFELATRLGVTRLIGIMYEKVWRSVYERRGVSVRFLSQPFKVDEGLPVVIGTVRTDATGLAALHRCLSTELANGDVAPALVSPDLLWAHRCHVRGDEAPRPRGPRAVNPESHGREAT